MARQLTIKFHSGTCIDIWKTIYCGICIAVIYGNSKKDPQNTQYQHHLPCILIAYLQWIFLPFILPLNKTELIKSAPSDIHLSHYIILSRLVRACLTSPTLQIKGVWFTTYKLLFQYKIHFTLKILSGWREKKIIISYFKIQNEKDDETKLITFLLTY